MSALTLDLFNVVPVAGHAVRIVLAHGAVILGSARYLRELRRIEEKYLILWDDGPIYDEDDNLYYEAWDRAFF